MGKEKRNQNEDAELDNSVAAIEAEGDAAAEPSKDDILDELARLQEFGESQKFASLDEVFACEENEQLGVWQRWTEVPEAEVLIAHLTAAFEKRENLEAKLRERKSIPLGVPLARRTQEALIRESWFGTVVKGWRGDTFKGTPWNEDNFRKLIKSRRFRVFVTGKATAAEAFRSGRVEALRGNS